MTVLSGAELAVIGASSAILEDLSGLAGQEISVPCSVDVAACGDFHSIKWYRESQRVFVFSELANLERSEGSLTNRYEIFSNIAYTSTTPPYVMACWRWSVAERSAVLYTVSMWTRCHLSGYFPTCFPSCHLSWDGRRPGFSFLKIMSLGACFCSTWLWMIYF